MSGRLRRLVLENLGLKLLSIGIAVVLFIFVRAEKQSVIQGAVNVRFTPPAGRMLVGTVPQRLRISVQGPASRIQRLRVEDIGEVHVDLKDVPPGYFRLTEDLISLPADAKVVSIRPAGFTVRYEQRVVRRLPVRVALQGEPAAGCRLLESTVDPLEITVAGPRSAVMSLAHVDTEPVVIEGARTSLSERVGLGALPPLVQALHLSSVVVNVKIEDGKRVAR